MVKAQLETWGSGIPRENFIIVGGKYDDVNFGLVKEPMPCGDTLEDSACKESVMLDRAISRAKQLDADWLAVSQDDKYIWPSKVQKELTKFDSGKPMVLTPFGCGQAWKYHTASLNGTLPQPNDFHETPFSCKAVYEQGGICGGPVYFVSRGAIDLLHTEGQTTADFLKEYIEGSESYTSASDIYSSCLMYKRQIPMSFDFNLDKGLITMQVDVNHDARKFGLTLEGVKAAVSETLESKKWKNAATVHFSGVPKKLISEYIRELHDQYP